MSDAGAKLITMLGEPRAPNNTNQSDCDYNLSVTSSFSVMGCGG